jgi:hypothetical protein
MHQEGQMQTLTIKAVSLESAHGFCGALARFQTELIEADHGTYQVQVKFGNGDREIIAVLNSLEEYVTHRADGPATIGLDGRRYELHPAV